MTSHPKIVVGIDGTPRGEDAVAFATVLARMVGTRLLLTYIYGPEERLADAHALLDPRRDAISDVSAEVTAYSDPSPARGLARVAAARNADIIVVGSSHRAGIGLVVPGSTGERLLHDTARAVVIVPRYWRPSHTGPLTRVGCGYDGSPQSEATRATAIELAGLAGGEPEVVHVLPADSSADATDAVGDPARTLIAWSHELDLLVLGSRRKGPINAAVSGSVSSHVIRESACPVLVVTHDVPPVVRDLEHAGEELDVLCQVTGAEKQVADA